MDKTTIYLPPDIQQSLVSAAKRLKVSKAALIREALRSYLSQQPKGKFRSLGRGEDSQLHAEDTEVWLKQRWGRGR